MNAYEPLKDETFGYLSMNLQRLRLDEMLTLKKAAELAGMHWRQLQKIEAGQSNVTLVTLVRLAEMLKVDVATLVREPALAMGD